MTTTSPSGIESFPDGSSRSISAEGVREIVLPTHATIWAVRFADQTDANNTLVQLDQYLLHPSDRPRWRGNLLVVRRSDGSGGWVAVKAGPLPGARAVPSEADAELRFEDGKPVLRLLADERYPWRVEAFEGEGWEGRLAMMRALSAAQAPALRRLDRRLLANTWGDRSRDGRMSAAFIRDEIKAAAELGVDVLQLDDGWQRGTSSNSVEAREDHGVWSGFYDADAGFWTPHPERFPDGLEPLVEEARAQGIELGLWFAPDSSNDFANWQRDAETVNRLRQDYGVRHFKFDAINTPTPEAEDNLRRLFDALLRPDDSAPVIDLDITAGQRPGYFGRIDCGPLFVANRYTDWANHWPHHTFRVLWDLAHWVPAQRLRMEFLNPRRNAERYGDDPLAPARVPITTSFAMVMLAQPLAWMEVSGLAAEDRVALRPLVEVWRQVRGELADHVVMPIGEAPDGYRTSGFAVYDLNNGLRYLLLVRGLGDHEPVRVGGAHVGSRCERLAGEGDVTLGHDTAELDGTPPMSFWFGRVIDAGSDSAR